ncbi:MAG: hypothetical protein H0U71_00095 [Gammaproteobacteria bacterium]|nr:hypothetical protein [Gammaproteobacteria bacterium]
MKCYFKEFTYKNAPLLWVVNEGDNTAVATQLVDPLLNKISKIQLFDLKHLSHRTDVILEQDRFVIKNFDLFRKKYGLKSTQYLQPLVKISSDSNLNDSLVAYQKLQSSSASELPDRTQNRSDDKEPPQTPPTTPRTSRALTSGAIGASSRGEELFHLRRMGIDAIDIPPGKYSLDSTGVEEIMKTITGLKPSRERFKLDKIIESLGGTSLSYTDLAVKNTRYLNAFKTKPFLSSKEALLFIELETSDKSLQLRKKQNEIFEEIVDQVFNKVLDEFPVNKKIFDALTHHIFLSVDAACKICAVRGQLFSGNFLHDAPAADILSKEETESYETSVILESKLITAMIRGFAINNLPEYFQTNLKILCLEDRYKDTYQRLFDTVKEWGEQCREKNRYKERGQEIYQKEIHFGDFVFKSIDLIIDKIIPAYVSNDSKAKFLAYKNTDTDKNIPPSPPLIQSKTTSDSQRSSRFSLFSRKLSGTDLKNEQHSTTPFKRLIISKIKEAFYKVHNNKTSADHSNNNNNNTNDFEKGLFIKQELEENFSTLLKDEFSLNGQITLKDLEVIKKQNDKHLVAQLENWQAKLNHASCPIIL